MRFTCKNSNLSLKIIDCCCGWLLPVGSGWTGLCGWLLPVGSGWTGRCRRLLPVGSGWAGRCSMVVGVDWGRRGLAGDRGDRRQRREEGDGEIGEERGFSFFNLGFNFLFKLINVLFF